MGPSFPVMGICATALLLSVFLTFPRSGNRGQLLHRVSLHPSRVHHGDNVVDCYELDSPLLHSLPNRILKLYIHPDPCGELLDVKLLCCPVLSPEQLGPPLVSSIKYQLDWPPILLNRPVGPLSPWRTVLDYSVGVFLPKS